MQKLLEGAAQEFTVKFTTRNQKPGRKKYVLTVAIKGAASIQVVLRANICTPEIDLSTSTINFDRVYVGCSKKIFFRLHNPTPVKVYIYTPHYDRSLVERSFCFPIYLTIISSYLYARLFGTLRTLQDRGMAVALFSLPPVALCEVVKRSSSVASSCL